MQELSRIVLPGENERSVVTANGTELIPPDDWVLLPPGDEALTFQVKKAGPCWQVRVKKGRKMYSGGVWAPESTVAGLKAKLYKNRKPVI